ncbi:nitroreductase family protein [Paenibacillus filicis]|uniref:Nitroreductase family protein n=1 Tax=Paenibacillus gyeongsangnamensis TaxID=3388067 RepID=A0ABT4QB03_9BACL|nr:nitroreductase family protein [Paenibacillus filicis]MCZ8514065.1 nitroreductase family protein [Paenibacillus filicis]
MSTIDQKLSAEEVILARHSVRKYQRGVTIPDAEWNEILELAASAPSSWNLQHWRFLVVREQENKDRLLPLAFGQQQVSDSSVTVIVLGDLQANLAAPKVFADATQEFRDMMIGQINGAYAGNPDVARDEAVRNASLAAMQLMLAAKAKGYDSVPMGGYDKDAVVKALNIPDRYLPVMMIAIGKAESPAHPTARLPLSDLIINESF